MTDFIGCQEDLVHRLRTTTLENVKLGQGRIFVHFVVLVQVLERFLYQPIRFLQEINERAVKKCY